MADDKRGRGVGPNPTAMHAAGLGQAKADADQAAGELLRAFAAVDRELAALGGLGIAIVVKYDDSVVEGAWQRYLARAGTQREPVSGIPLMPHEGAITPLAAVVE